MHKIRMWRKFHLATRYYNLLKAFSVDFITFTEVQTTERVKNLNFDLMTHNA